MSRWRVLTVVVLVLLPFVILAGVGSVYLWQSGLGFKVWWGMAACMALGYGLGWYWQHKRQLLRPVDFEPQPAWTERDRKAWELVEARAKAAPKVSADQLTELEFYVRIGQEMALELAQAYHPRAEDPVGSLTIPEVLAVIELAAHDLSELVDQYLPGGHLLTIRNWQQARQASDWYQTASKAYWLVAAVFSPVNTGIRYAASQAGLARPLQMLQQNLLLWFYTAFLQRLGTYLIELNSGRLRVGVKRYGELRQQFDGSVSETPAPEADRVTITVLGQVKAGKSSLINALLGEQKAQTDVLPATAEVTRYELQPPGVSSRLSILDTVGYGHTGAKADQLKATQEAARQSDLLLLVLHARNPARQADVDTLRALQSWFASNPELKMPPVLGVMTHIDLLSPALEWHPPYNWQEPLRPKEKQIQEALTAVRDQIGTLIVGAAPVCVAEGRVYGVEEWLLPAVTELLTEARAVALLRCLRAEADAGKIRKVLSQLAGVGRETIKALWTK